ncbi:MULTISPECIES: methyltransferase domain-containing protein [unclassified Nocardiopsis]|uniref:methyltransferase n=1 Tax=unclassified Nocardiopsis TaxID=2649073 RepID=UPI00135BA847|nr:MULTISPECIES: methyltransferase domain-containing protein [unclassified Nocardiopsis]
MSVVPEGTGPGTFDRGADSWARWRETPWGRMRYLLVAHTLATALESLGPGCRVLDIGGGDGADSLPLAALGHQVTILDGAPTLLRRARERAAAEGLAGSVRVVCADLEEAAPAGPDGAAGSGYDLVLCHNVVQYTADVGATVDLVARSARVGGVVSVLAPNPAMDVLAAAVRRSDPSAALAVLGTATVRSETFGHDMRRVERGTVEDALLRSGCSLTHRFGLRCVTDLVADDERKHDADFFEELYRLEVALCDREEFRNTARFWQVLAVRG